MKIFAVTHLVDPGTEPATRAITSVHISRDKAQQLADGVAVSGAVETIELDLTGDASALQQLRDEVIRQQARLARGRRL